MAYDKIIEQLKTLKKVKPDDHFKENTRRMILATDKEQPTITNYFPSWGLAGAFALVLLVTGTIFVITPSTQVNSFDTEELQSEFQNLNIEIEQISYTQETSKTIASALNEISNTKANHLNKSILEKEQNSLEEINGSDSKNINQMLNKIIF